MKQFRISLPLNISLPFLEVMVVLHFWIVASSLVLAVSFSRRLPNLKQNARGLKDLKYKIGHAGQSGFMDRVFVDLEWKQNRLRMRDDFPYGIVLATPGNVNLLIHRLFTLL